MVSYHDTHAFYDRHYDEIEDTRVQLTEEGIAPQVDGDLKNFYAWLGFEEVAYQMSLELGLE